MCTKGICWLSIGWFYQPIYRPTVGRYISPFAVNMLTEIRPTISRHVIQVNRPSIDTIGWYVGWHLANTSTAMLQSTIDRMYRLTIGGIGVLLTASLPSGNVKEESLSSMLKCWYSKDVAQTAIISNTYLMQLEVSTSIAGKNSLWDRWMLLVWKVKNGQGLPKDPFKGLQKII